MLQWIISEIVLEQRNSLIRSDNCRLTWMNKGDAKGLSPCHRQILSRKTYDQIYSMSFCKASVDSCDPEFKILVFRVSWLVNGQPWIACWVSLDFANHSYALSLWSWILVHRKRQNVLWRCHGVLNLVINGQHSLRLNHRCGAVMQNSNWQRWKGWLNSPIGFKDHFQSNSTINSDICEVVRKTSQCPVVNEGILTNWWRHNRDEVLR